MNKEWNIPETAPKDRVVVLDTDYCWPIVGMWNESMQEWVVAEVEWNIYQGKGDPAFITEYVKTIKGWREL